MTIDEVIAEEKELYEIMKDKYEKLNVKTCKDRAEEHKQMIEWLEELKAIRQWKADVMGSFCKYDVNSFEELISNARAKAIDEFVKAENYLMDKIKEETADVNIDFEWRKVVCLDDIRRMLHQGLYEIAEQLKENENDKRN